jgi:hypothetical protein
MTRGDRTVVFLLLLALESAAAGGAFFTHWHWLFRGFALTMVFVFGGLLYRAMNRWL